MLGRGVRLQTEPEPDHPSPTYIAAANDAAKRIAERLGGVPQSSITEALANIPGTAHILGGAVIGKDEQHGVIDRDCRAYHYRNLVVCDGAPSLTITALAEHAMSTVPPKPGAEPAPPTELLHRTPRPQAAVIPGDILAERAAGLRGED